MTSESSLKLLLVEDSPADAGLIQANLRIGLGTVDVHRVDRLSTACLPPSRFWPETCFPLSCWI